eukprot:3882957-Rhodomonas_salina.1
MTQGLNADRRAHKLNPVTPQVGDLVLLNTVHYNLMLPSQKLAPKWVRPLLRRLGHIWNYEGP